MADDDVEAKVLERRVEDLLGGTVQPVDLVNEEHVAGLECRQDRGDVALPLESRSCNLTDTDSELIAHDLGERRLAEPGRAGEEDVVEGLSARLGRSERDRKLLLDPLLPDEVGQRLWPQRALEARPRRRRVPARGTASCCLPQGVPHLLLDRQVRIDLGEHALGIEQ